jgi:transcriptional regulator EpsA
MLSTFSHAPEVCELFLRGVEAAHEIGSSQQFFVWMRSYLHRFVPHDLALLWFDAEGHGTGRRAHVYNCVPLSPRLMSVLADPAQRFWAAWAERWFHEGERALWVDLAERMPCGSAPITELGQAGFHRALVHGMNITRRGGEGLVVAFLQQDATATPPSDKTRVALDLWMPYVHFALSRIESNAAQRAPLRAHEASKPRALTARELQVLSAVRDAKANAQIAVMLGISPLTVKNHLRSIQKKLGARNRAHAVAEAMSLRLIS